MNVPKEKISCSLATPYYYHGEFSNFRVIATDTAKVSRCFGWVISSFSLVFGVLSFCFHSHELKTTVTSQCIVSCVYVCCVMWLHVHILVDLLELCLLPLLNFALLRLWKVEHAISKRMHLKSHHGCETRQNTKKIDRQKERNFWCDHSFIFRCFRFGVYVLLFPYTLIYFHIISYFISNLWNLLETWMANNSLFHTCMHSAQCTCTLYTAHTTNTK